MNMKSIEDFLHGGESLCTGKVITSGQIISNLFAIAIVYSILTTLLTVFKKWDTFTTEQKVGSVLLLLVHSVAAFILLSHAHRCRSGSGILKAIVITVVAMILINNLLNMEPAKRAPTVMTQYVEPQGRPEENQPRYANF